MTVVSFSHRVHFAEFSSVKYAFRFQNLEPYVGRTFVYIFTVHSNTSFTDAFIAGLAQWVRITGIRFTIIKWVRFCRSCCQGCCRSQCQCRFDSCRCQIYNGICLVNFFGFSRIPAINFIQWNSKFCNETWNLRFTEKRSMAHQVVKNTKCSYQENCSDQVAPGSQKFSSHFLFVP